MSKIDLNIPSIGSKFIDLRDSIPGDSYNWGWNRPLSQVKYLAIHHTAGPDTQSPTEIANYHINHNGWGGIGYHFLISKDGTVYYVGDIGTARANVLNLNEQVIGICLVGNFTSGRVPSSQQLDSAHLLSDFFINNYPDLINVSSWEVVCGHKELPGQSTTCPGDNWPAWRPKIVNAISTPVETNDRGAQITESYRSVLGRDPDMGGLQTYTNGPMSQDQILRNLVDSVEHQNLIRLAKKAPGLESQIDNLQTSLSSINQQIITLQETVQKKEEEIQDLKNRLSESQPIVITAPPPQPPPPLPQPPPPKVDTTVTIIGGLINLYKFIFSSRSTN